MRKLFIIMTLFLNGIFILAILSMALGFRINLTDSIPVGLYRISHVGNLKNSYIIFCPDNRQAFRIGLEHGYIDKGLNCGGYGYLMKKVVAVQGDIVSVTNKGVFVNHIRLSLSKPKLNDGWNRPLPQWRISNYELKKNELLTMTNQSEWSFDSRYFGLVYTRQIKGMIRLLWALNKLEISHDM